jgi:hypothetical protein
MNISNYTVAISILAAFILSACQSGGAHENKKLTQQLDSVNHELELTRQALLDSEQVKALLDSIDASRKVTVPTMAGKNTVSRLNDLNEYVKDIDLKMDQMENSIKYVNTLAASILRLQADVKTRTQKIALLEAEAKKQSASDTISLVIHRKDSTFAVFIEHCQQDIAVLLKAMEEVHTKNNQATADLYFKQAEALASMAQNVNTSTKRKLVKRQALEMYKISYSLGQERSTEKDIRTGN